MIRRVLLLAAILVVGACPLRAQTVEVVGSTLAVGSSPSSPSGTSVSLKDLATSGTGLPLWSVDDASGGGLFRRAIGKSDLPATVGYTDEAETWALLQTFTSGLTSNGLLTIGGSNDLLLGTGGMRVASGSILFRNIADSGNNATIGDSAIALNQNTAVTGTFSASGLATLTGGFTAGASSTVNAALTVTGLTTAALIKTTGVYGVSSPFTVYATDATTPRLQVADGGPIVLTDTGTDSYLRYAATGNSSGERQWRAGNVAGDFLISGGNDAASVWSTLASGTQTAGVPNGWYWGTGVADVNPLLSYQTKLGTDIFKYLSLSAAELKVGTIVAQDYIATIGGRVLVLPTTQLTEDLGDAVGDTTITVEHNEIASGDRVLLEADGKVEFLAIASGATGTGGGALSVTRTGAASAGATTITLPTHASGDTIVIFAYRASSTGGVSLPGTWTSVCDEGLNNNSYRVGYKVAASSGETSGTWTNATHLHAAVYQGVTGFGACATLSATGTTTLSYPALTLTDGDGSSKVARFGMAGAGTNVEAQTPAGGYGLVTDFDATQDSAVFESTAGVTSVTQSDVTLDASGNVRGVSVELLGTVTPTTGPYSYTVTRDLDTTGRNLWYKGDAVANTGATGDGFWDIYSIQSTKGGAEAGPTMCANERTSATYNAWSARFCAGNLYGLYGNAASNLYGMAFGNYSDVWGQMDATNGLRFFEGSTNQKLRIDPTGYVLIGTSGSGQANTYIDNTSLKLRRGTVDYVTLASTGLTMTDGTDTRVQLDATDGLLLGRTAAGQGNILADTSGNLLMRSGTVERIRVNATNGSVTIFDDDGATARVNISSTIADFGTTAAHRFTVNYADGTLRAYDSASKQYFQLDATNGVRVGDWYTAGGAYLQATATALNFCKASGGCPLTFDGSTGNITSSGALSIQGAASIGGSGSFVNSGITIDTTGIRSSVPASAVATGSSYRFAFTNGVTSGGLYAFDDTTASTLQVLLAGTSVSDDYRNSLLVNNTSFGTVSANVFSGPTEMSFNVYVSDGASNTNTFVVGKNFVQIDGSTTESKTITVRDAAGTGSCTIVFVYGMKTGGTC